MEIHVSLAGRGSLSREIYRQLRDAIMDGRLRAGDALLPTREMARQLSVARTTVTVAYDRLAAEGFIAARVGSGTFVNALPERVPPRARQSRKQSTLTARAVWESIPFPNAFAEKVAFDFRSGLPDATLFPHDIWHRLMLRELRSNAARSGIYGHPAGHFALREAIARHVGVSRGVVCSADDITITNGTQQAFEVITRVLIAPGDRVVVEDPGYTPIRYLLESVGARVIGVRVDGEGLVVDSLPRNARLVYVTPSHQYPLGVAMTLERRLELLSWAERNNAAIVEDDYDSEFRFGGRPIEPLHMLDSAGRVIYVGSFSKTLLPTLRLGFLVSPPSLRDAVHRAKFVSDWHSSMPVQAALARFIDEGGFARHVRKLSAVYRARHALIAETIASDFDEHLDIVASSAGLHIAALSRRGSVKDIDGVVRRAFERAVGVQPLARFAVRRPLAGLLVAYGAIPTALIGEGLARLRECFGR